MIPLKNTFFLKARNMIQTTIMKEVRSAFFNIIIWVKTNDHW